MGLMDKVKKILFDEDEVEIPISGDVLPDVSRKQVKEEKIDNEVKFEEEDTIKEVIVPKEDGTRKRFNFPIDIDDDFDDIDEPVVEKSVSDVVDHSSRVESSSFADSRREYRFERSINSHEEKKDYRKMVNDDKNDKKPFKVTPIISPVYGVLDKNYTPERIVEKNTSALRNDKNRTFGPVSYNDEPLPVPKVVVPHEKKSLTEELLENAANDADIINEPVDKVIKSGFETITSDNSITDDVDTNVSSIESEYIENNSIEDAFETTSEFNKIQEEDLEKNYVEESEELEEDSDEVITNSFEETEDIPVVDIENLINKKEEYDEEDENLDNTIETDLFNLIDSMYKSDDDEEEDSYGND